jgi:hypothetical protein
VRPDETGNIVNFFYPSAVVYLEIRKPPSISSSPARREPRARCWRSLAMASTIRAWRR